MKRIPKIVKLNGYFSDQRGIAERGKITGFNGYGVKSRRYVWIEPEIPELKGKSFQAFDDQIIRAMK
jgi:hypothetical protein